MSKTEKMNKKRQEQLVITILERARELVRKGWTRNQMAATKNGKQTDTKSDAACKFCTMGAVGRAYLDLTGDKGNIWFSAATRSALSHLEAFAGTSIASFNDSQTTKKPILALFDKALAKLDAA